MAASFYLCSLQMSFADEMDCMVYNLENLGYNTVA